MAFELRVFMTGLGLFVPSKKDPDSSSPGTTPRTTDVHMLMVNAVEKGQITERLDRVKPYKKDPDRVKPCEKDLDRVKPCKKDLDRVKPCEKDLDRVKLREKAPPRRVSPHRPLVQYDLRNRRGNRPNYPLFQDKTGNIKGIWFLDKSTLCIEAPRGLTLAPLAADFEEVRTEIPQSQGDLFSLGWISPIRDHDGKLARIDKKFLSETLDEGLRDEVSARFHISNGRLRVASLAAERRMTEKGDKQVQIYKYGPNRTQAAATVVELNLWVEADEIFLVKKPFDPSIQNSDYLILGPNRRNQGGGRDDLVEIWVMNEELDSVYQQMPTSSRRLSVDDRNKQEFQLLQSLTLKPGNTDPAPDPPKRIKSKSPKFQPDANVIEDGAMKSQLFTLLPGETGQGSSCRPARAEEEEGG